MIIKAILAVLNFLCAVFSSRHAYHRQEGQACNECRGCRRLIRPMKRFEVRVQRFRFALKGHLWSITSPENLALGISAVLYAFFYGVLFTPPVYMVGKVIASSLIFQYGSLWVIWWDLETAWALTTFCMLLLKNISFTLYEGEEEMGGSEDAHP